MGRLTAEQRRQLARLTELATDPAARAAVHRAAYVECLDHRIGRGLAVPEDAAAFLREHAGCRTRLVEHPGQ